jgi:nucleolar protein 56
LLATAPQKEHGKRARALADKISLAAKVDYFKGEFIGDRLRKELEERFK